IPVINGTVLPADPGKGKFPPVPGRKDHPWSFVYRFTVGAVPGGNIDMDHRVNKTLRRHPGVGDVLDLHIKVNLFPPAVTPNPEGQKVEEAFIRSKRRVTGVNIASRAVIVPLRVLGIKMDCHIVIGPGAGSRRTGWADHRTPRTGQIAPARRSRAKGEHQPKGDYRPEK